MNTLPDLSVCPWYSRGDNRLVLTFGHFFPSSRSLLGYTCRNRDEESAVVIPADFESRRSTGSLLNVPGPFPRLRPCI